MPATEVGYIINSMFVLRLIITWYVYQLPKFIKFPKICKKSEKNGSDDFHEAR